MPKPHIGSPGPYEGGIIPSNKNVETILAGLLQNMMTDPLQVKKNVSLAYEYLDEIERREEERFQQRKSEVEERVKEGLRGASQIVMDDMIARLQALGEKQEPKADPLDITGIVPT